MKIECNVSEFQELQNVSKLDQKDRVIESLQADARSLLSKNIVFKIVSMIWKTSYAVNVRQALVLQLYRNCSRPTIRQVILILADLIRSPPSKRFASFSSVA